MENAAFRAQVRLLEGFVAMARSPIEGEMLKACLQQTLRLATELTGAEGSSIFLVDKNGVVTDSILARQTPVKEKSRLIGSVMDKGLAGWVYKHRVHCVVHDTDNDSRWLPMKNQPYTIGSALAVPIGRREALFGILTLHHTQKNHFNEDLIEAMKATADQMALALENVRLYVDLAKAKATVDIYSKALNKEMEKGRKIQKDFLPADVPRSPNLEIAANFTPALQVSGDFYDAFVLPGDLVGIVIGDVSDKGVGAALYMALIRSFIRMFARQCCEEKRHGARQDLPTGDIQDILQVSALRALEITNNYLTREHGAEGMFATVFFGVINTRKGVIQYINAGHPPVYAIEQDGGLRNLSTTGPAVGLQGDIEYRIKKLGLQPQTILFGYTDGVTEAFSTSGKMYGKERLERLIVSAPSHSAGAFIRHVHEHLLAFVGSAPQSDDTTMLAAQWKR